MLTEAGGWGFVRFYSPNNIIDLRKLSQTGELQVDGDGLCYFGPMAAALLGVYQNPGEGLDQLTSTAYGRPGESGPLGKFGILRIDMGNDRWKLYSAGATWVVKDEAKNKDCLVWRGGLMWEDQPSLVMSAFQLSEKMPMDGLEPKDWKADIRDKYHLLGRGFSSGADIRQLKGNLIEGFYRMSMDLVGIFKGPDLDLVSGLRAGGKVRMMSELAFDGSEAHRVVETTQNQVGVYRLNKAYMEQYEVEMGAISDRSCALVISDKGDGERMFNVIGNGPVVNYAGHGEDVGCLVRQLNDWEVEVAKKLWKPVTLDELLEEGRSTWWTGIW